MNNTSAFILYSLAVFGTIFLYLYDVPDIDNDIEQERQRILFPTLTSQNLKKIIITNNEYRLILNKATIGWHTSYSANNNIIIKDIANRFEIKELVNDLIKLKFEKKLEDRSLNLSFYKPYNLKHKPNKSISIYYGNLMHTLYLGHKIERSNNFNIYVKLDKEEGFFLVDEKISYWVKNIKRNPDIMRTTRVFHIPFKTIPKKFIFQNRDNQKLTLSHYNRSWYLKLNNNYRDRADNRVCRKFLEILKEIKIQRFLYGVSQEVQNEWFKKFILIGYENGQNKEYMIVGKKTEKKNSAGYYGAKVIFKNQQLHILYCYIINSSWLEQIPKQFSTFRDKSIIDFSLEKINKIISRGTSNWELKKGKDGWAVITPKKKKISGKKVYKFLQNILSLRAKSFLQKKLEQNLSNILIIRIDKNKHYKLNWGYRGDDIIVKQTHDKILRVLTDKTGSVLKTDYLDFYDNRVDAFIFADVTKIELRRPGRIYNIYKKDKIWYIKKPVIGRGNKENIEKILRNFAWVMADSVLGEAKERKKYNCLNSGYKLHITSNTEGQNKICTIEIGKNIGRKYCAVYFSNYPYIYKVKIGLKNSLMIEFHHSFWISKNFSLKKAAKIEITYGDKIFIWKKQKQCYLGIGNSAKISDQKKDKIFLNLKKISINKIVFGKYNFSEPLLTIKVFFQKEKIKKLMIIEKNGELFGLFDNKFFLMKPDALAILIQLLN